MGQLDTRLLERWERERSARRPAPTRSDDGALRPDDLFQDALERLRARLDEEKTSLPKRSETLTPRN